MLTHSALFTYIQLHPIIGYIAAFLFMVFEGDAPLFIFGFLTNEGLFNPYLIFVFLYAGTVIGDALWYVLGEYVKNYPRIERWANRLAAPLDAHLRERPFRTIFISQFAYGIHHAIWVHCGLLRLPFKRLMRIDAFASIFWVLIVGGLGYAASATLLPIGRYLKYAEVTILLGFAAFLIIQHYIAKVSEKKL